MDQRRRHLHVADITCLHCAEKDSELEAKEEIIRKLAVENSELADKYRAAIEAAEAAGRAAANAKGRLTKQVREDARNEDIDRLLEFWREAHQNADIDPVTPMGGKRWEVCRKALILMADAEAGPVAACLEALEGIRLFPFMDMKTFQRHPENTGRNLKRKDDVEHALGDEVRIAKARSLSRWARGDLTDRCWQQYQWCQRAADYWMDLVMEGLGERHRRPIAEMAEKAMRENEGA